MNDEEEVVVTESNPEQASEQETSSSSSISTRRGKSLGDRLDNVSEGIEKAGKTVENFGKGEEKFANLIDGGEKGINATAKAGEAASSAAEKGTKAAEKVADARAKAAHAAAEGAKGAKTAAKTGKAASEAADRGAEAGKAASKALESNQYTAAAGAVGEAASTAAQVAAKTAKAGFTAGEAASGTAEGTARAAEAEAKAEKAGLKAAHGAEKAAKTGAKTASKATDGSFADKLRKHGKLNQMHGKRMQDLSKKFKSDEFLDDLTGKLGVGGKILKTVFGGIIKAFDPKTIIIVTTLLVIIIHTIVIYILSPMFYMDKINEGIKDGTVDKVQNFISGLGFRSSEEAFYKEVNYLNTHYGKELDFPYIMATLYYVDIFYGGSNTYGQNDSFCESVTDENSKNMCDKLTLGYRLAKYYLNAANSSIGEDGLTYSSHKLYRMRELAKHQFAGDMTEVSVTLTEYLELCGERLKNEIGNLVDYIPMLLIYVLCSGNPLFASTINKIKALQGFNDLLGLLDGTENWKSIELYIKNGEGNFNGVKQALKNLLEVFFGSFYNIKSISINLGNANELNSDDTGSSGNDSDKCTGANERLSSDGKTCICKKYYARDNNGSCAKKDAFDILLEKATDAIQVEYYKESYSQDEYENYLVDHYIREMPEFSKLIKDGDKIDDEKVLKIAYQIRSTKELFDSLYKKDESAEEDTKCIGNINLDLLSELNNPIDLTDGQKITFSGTNNYGLYKGNVHHGVDLEELSTGTKAGANVYSLYDGKVISSTVDGTYKDKNAKGGWVVIEYTVQFEDSSMGESKLAERFKNHVSRIQVYYGGLNASDLKLKKGSAVKKGETIGHVGSAAESENGIRPSLHFAIYDVINSNFLNPINMFITCKSSGTNTKMCGVTNEQKVWTFLLSKGYTKEAAAGIMGVWKRESAFKPYIVQGHSDSFSKSYTADVDSGKISKKKFKNDKIGGGGYGLAQWTSANRKEDLYEFAKKKGKSIGDLEVQLEFIEKEINSGSYKGIKSKLNNADSIDETTKIFLNQFEGGAGSSLKLRTGYAKDIYNKYKNFSCK